MIQKATGRVRITQPYPHMGTWYRKGEEYDVYNFDHTRFACVNAQSDAKPKMIDKNDCELIPMIEHKGMKFRISSPEYSEQLQKYLFGLGVHWTGTSATEVVYTHLPFLYIGPRGWLEYTDSESLFNDVVGVEYTLQEEIVVTHVLKAVEPRKTVLIDGVEVDEDLIKKALMKYTGSTE